MQIEYGLRISFDSLNTQKFIVFQKTNKNNNERKLDKVNSHTKIVKIQTQNVCVIQKKNKKRNMYGKKRFLFRLGLVICWHKFEMSIESSSHAYIKYAYFIWKWRCILFAAGIESHCWPQRAFTHKHRRMAFVSIGAAEADHWPQINE